MLNLSTQYGTDNIVLGLLISKNMETTMKLAIKFWPAV